MWSEFALQKAKGQTSLEEDQYDTFKKRSHKYNLLPILCLCLSLTHIVYTQPFSDGNSPDVQQQGTPLKAANDKHANTFSPGSRLQEAKFSKHAQTSSISSSNYFTELTKMPHFSHHIWE